MIRPALWSFFSQFMGQRGSALRIRVLASFPRTSMVMRPEQEWKQVQFILKILIASILDRGHKAPTIIKGQIFCMNKSAFSMAWSSWFSLFLFWISDTPIFASLHWILFLVSHFSITSVLKVFPLNTLFLRPQSLTAGGLWPTIKFLDWISVNTPHKFFQVSLAFIKRLCMLFAPTPQCLFGLN